MPLYEYACKSCEHEFEVLVRGSEQPACPACAGHDLQRKLSAFAAQTKGASAAPMAAPGACGRCGDPRGPGACSLN